MRIFSLPQQFPILSRATYLLALFGILSGCATGSAVVVGEARPTTSTDNVRVLVEPPEKPFETIALVESRREIGFSRQGATDVALEELKKQAAKVGANAVILEGSGVESGGGAVIGSTAGGIGSFTVVEDEFVVMKGKAIYIAEE